jgi:long-chain acyl-CoA synthetase
MYTHGQLAIACRSLGRAFPELASGGKYVCWLPMAHMFQRMMNYVAMAQNGQIFFQEDPREILSCLREVQPEFFIAVPRLYEKLHEGMQTELANSPPLRRWMARCAIHVGNRHASNKRQGQKDSLLVGTMYRLADRLVLQRIRSLLGGKLRYMMTGSAPMSPELLEFFHSLGWLVLEAYGVSENVVPMTVQPAASIPVRFGRTAAAGKRDSDCQGWVRC